MPKFTASAAAHDATGKLHTFQEGDVVPAWLKGRVGDHLLDKPFAKGSKTATKKDAPNPDDDTEAAAKAAVEAEEQAKAEAEAKAKAAAEGDKGSGDAKTADFTSDND